MSRAALEYVSQGTLGFTFHALDDNTEISEYRDAIKLVRYLVIFDYG